jgi:hypothetical protein
MVLLSRPGLLCNGRDEGRLRPTLDARGSAQRSSCQGAHCAHDLSAWSNSMTNGSL